MTASTNVDRDYLAAAREFAPPGATLYTVLRHCSASCMTRWIDVYAIVGNEPRYLSYTVAKVIGRQVNTRGHEGIVCHGAGMDMGFDLVYSLSREIHGDGYALNHRWL